MVEPGPTLSTFEKQLPVSETPYQRQSLTFLASTSIVPVASTLVARADEPKETACPSRRQNSGLVPIASRESINK